MKKWIVGGLSILVVYFAYSWFLPGKSLTKKYKPNSLVRISKGTFGPSLTSPQSGAVEDREVATDKEDENALLTVAGADYFNEIVSDPNTNKLFAKTVGILGESQESVGAAMWMTMGVRFESSKEYGRTLNSALDQANKGADTVYQKVMDKIDEIRKDPFVYQMTMNLIAKLAVEKAKRTEFFGRELETQLGELTHERPRDQFWVANLGLHLAKENGVEAKDLAPFISRGLKKTRAQQQIFEDFVSNAKFYFPELTL